MTKEGLDCACAASLVLGSHAHLASAACFCYPVLDAHSVPRPIARLTYPSPRVQPKQFANPLEIPDEELGQPYKYIEMDPAVMALPFGLASRILRLPTSPPSHTAMSIYSDSVRAHLPFDAISSHRNRWQGRAEAPLQPHQAIILLSVPGREGDTCAAVWSDLSFMC